MFPSKASVARNLILNFSLFLVSCESCEPMVETPQSNLPSSSPPRCLKAFQKSSKFLSWFLPLHKRIFLDTQWLWKLHRPRKSVLNFLSELNSMGKKSSGIFVTMHLSFYNFSFLFPSLPLPPKASKTPLPNQFLGLNVDHFFSTLVCRLFYGQ